MAVRDTDVTCSQISLLLMQHFHKLGVNKKVRLRRKKVWKLSEQLYSFIARTVFGLQIDIKVFGSQIEGSTTPGLQSDIDTAHFNTEHFAVRNKQDAVPGVINYLMITDEHTFPGYFKLQWLIPTLSGFIPMYRGVIDPNRYVDFDYKGCMVLNSSNYVGLNEYNVRHGPAATYTVGTFKGDLIPCIKVNRWVEEAIPWLMRHRQCSWITPNNLDYFHKKKAFLDPVGHTLSNEKDLEWRISFTSIERELMWRLNNTQMCCYILMKIIIKSFITPTIGECLSSYYCKTVLFYLVDNTPKIFWKPNNLLSCLKLILTTISLRVKEGLCPNYFIPKENMFLGKLTGRVRQQLHQILVSLIDMEFKYLLLIECDQLGQALSNACSRLSTLQETPSDIRNLLTGTDDKTLCFRMTSLVYKEILKVIFGYIGLLRVSGQNVSEGLIFTLIHEFQTGNRVLKDLLYVMTAFFSSHFGCQLASSCFASQNFHPQDIDTAHKFLLHGARSDVASGKLKLAGFYLKLGDPARAESVLSTVAQELVHHVSEIDICNVHQGYLKDTTCEKIISEKLTTTQISETCIAASVIYLQSEIHITLPPLCYEMFRSMGSDPALRDPEGHYYYDWAVMDARSYLYFLQHQTYSALGMDRHRQVALDNLAWSISDLLFPETGLNLLAYCLRHDGFLEQARLTLLKSLQIKPEHNAAVWQIFEPWNQLYQS